MRVEVTVKEVLRSRLGTLIQAHGSNSEVHETHDELVNITVKDTQTLSWVNTNNRDPGTVRRVSHGP